MKGEKMTISEKIQKRRRKREKWGGSPCIRETVGKASPS